MLQYSANLKDKARQLRRNLTNSEKALGSRMRSKQVLGIQFYRQKPIGEHMVDFFAPRAKLVVEVDGSQHAVIEAIYWALIGQLNTEIPPAPPLKKGGKHGEDS